MQRGDPAAAVQFFRKSIDLLHTMYGYLGMDRRLPSERDAPILDGFVDALTEVRERRPGAPVDDVVREVTHRLRSIATATNASGLYAQPYLEALDAIRATAPDVDVSGVRWD